MFDVILAVLFFHTISSISLLTCCAMASLLRPSAPRALHAYVDQSELDAEAILSNPVMACASQPAADRPAAAPLDVAAVA
ncbi:MAG: hypothetical protein ABIT36_00155 [Steroidobacteraceae bacterium]